MAIYRAFQQVDFRANGEPAGLQTTQQTATTIVRTDGVYTETFQGDFQFAANGDVSGTLDSLSATNNGQPVFAVSQIDGDASDANALIGGDFVTAWSGILSGEDRITSTSGNDYLRGFDGNDFINGSSGNDVLLGERGHDTLIGGDGADYLDGSSGADAMRGGAGDDRYFSDNVRDRITENSDSGNDTLFSSVSRALFLNVENLTLTGTEAAWAVGNASNNTIMGNNLDNALAGGAGNDTLYGGAGNDRLNGGPGGDHLIGGAGADMFIFTDPVGQDVVHAYEHTVDRLNFAAIDADIGLAGDQAFHYIGRAEFTGTAGELHYNGETLAGDTNGDGSADFAITIANHVAITQPDLIL